MKIVIADDHGLVRHLLRNLCADDFGYDIIGEAGSGREAIDVILQTKPELALLDIRMSDFGALRVLHVLREAGFSPRFVLLLSADCDSLTTFLVERARVNGFVDKRAARIEDLRHAFETVAGGGTYWSAKFAEVSKIRRVDPNSFDKMLSDRELEILVMLGQLHSDQEIAAHLGIAHDTVEKHRGNIFGKLGLHSRLDLMRYARSHGFLDSNIYF